MDKPVFNHLVDLADVQGERVELIARAGNPMGCKGREYRELEILRIRNAEGKVSATHFIRGNDLEAAAEALTAAV
jgi:hypothetical protein